LIPAMRIVVVGAGPIGGIVGGRLARAGHDVTFADVDVSHIAAIRESGLHVDVPDGSFTVSVPAVLPGEVRGEFDVGIIAVRSNYTREALASTVPHLRGDAVLVSLQNGINPPLLEACVGPERTVGAVVRMRSFRVAAGHLRTALRGRLFIGHLSGKRTPQLETVHALLNTAVPTEISEKIYGMLWSKLTFSCLGMFGSLAEGSLDAICSHADNRRLCVEFLGEMTAVGTAAGVCFEPLAEYHPMAFHPRRPLAERLRAFHEATERNWASYRQDSRTHALGPGEITHVDYTVGHLVTEGARVGVPTPLCLTLARMIHELEDGKRSPGLKNYAELAGA